VDDRVVSEGVLIVAAKRKDGYREIPAVDVADTESEATYQELFRFLKARGLMGISLVVSDDHEGLKRAIERHFQGVRIALPVPRRGRDVMNSYTNRPQRK
jgi:putative transposase